MDFNQYFHFPRDHFSLFTRERNKNGIPGRENFHQSLELIRNLSPEMKRKFLKGWLPSVMQPLQECARKESTHALLSIPEEEVHIIKYCPTTNRLLSVSPKGGVKLWETTQTTQVPITFDTPAEVTAATFNSTGTHLATGHYDGLLSIWDTTIPTKPIKTVPLSNSISSLCFSPANNKLIASSDESIHLIELQDNSMHTFFTEETITSLACSPDSTYCSSGSAEGSIHLWDITRKDSKPNEIFNTNSWITSLSFSNDGEKLAWATNDLTSIWNLRKSKPGSILNNEGLVKFISFSPDSKCIAASTHTGRVNIWDIKHKNCIQSLIHKKPVHSLSFNHTGNNIATASGNYIRTWEAHTKDYRKQMKHMEKYLLKNPDAFISLLTLIFSNKIGQSVHEIPSTFRHCIRKLYPKRYP